MEPPDPYTPQFTPEGAITAATYFLNLYPYVYATGDIDAFEKMSDDNCGFCRKVMANATARHESGGWADPWVQETTPLEYLVDDTDSNRYVVRTQVISEAHTAHSEDGEPSAIEASDDILLVQIYWTGSSWSVEAVEAVGPEDRSDSE